MKHVKMNYRQKSISALMDSGLTSEEATSFYNKVYNQALRIATKDVRGNLNISRELYSNMFIKNRTENVFQIDYLNKKVVLNKVFEKSEDIAFDKTIMNMENFMRKYYNDSVRLKEIFREYKNHNITRKEFNSQIKEWKKYNIKFLVSGSK